MQRTMRQLSALRPSDAGLWFQTRSARAQFGQDTQRPLLRARPTSLTAKTKANTLGTHLWAIKVIDADRVPLPEQQGVQRLIGSGVIDQSMMNSLLIFALGTVLVQDRPLPVPSPPAEIPTQPQPLADLSGWFVASEPFGPSATLHIEEYFPGTASRQETCSCWPRGSV